MMLSTKTQIKKSQTSFTTHHRNYMIISLNELTTLIRSIWLMNGMNLDIKLHPITQADLRIM